MPPKRINTPQGNPGAPPPPMSFEEMISQQVDEVLANYEVIRNNASWYNGGGGGGGSNGEPRNGPFLCSYKDFQNCKPKSFHGNEGVVGLMR